jgi:hypothetical protein
VNINKIALIEKLVDRVGQYAPHTERAPKSVRPRAEMSDGSEILVGMALFSAKDSRALKRPQISALSAIDLKGLLALA